MAFCLGAFIEGRLKIRMIYDDRIDIFLIVEPKLEAFSWFN